MYFEAFKLSSKKEVQVPKNSVSVAKLQDAKLYWYRQIQWEMYQAEYERLNERDRLLQVGGRLQSSDLPEGTKHPIILSHGHPMV